MYGQFQAFTDKGFEIKIGTNVFWPKMQDYTDYATIARYFEQVDIVFFSWGETLFGLDAIGRKGKDAKHEPWSLMKHIRYLKSVNKLPVIFGGSAGLIAWFDAGHSDSCDNVHPYPLTRVPALGLLPGFVCPHFDIEADPSTTAPTTIGKDLSGHTYRGYDFALHLAKDTGDEMGLALDNDVAIAITGETYSVFPTPPWRPSWWPTKSPNAYKISKATASKMLNHDGSISPTWLSWWWYSVRANHKIAKQGKLATISQPGRFWADPALVSKCHDPESLPTADHPMAKPVVVREPPLLQKIQSIIV
jgi:hypothetical protein